MKIGIAGAGLVGRLLAWQCVQQGYDVTLYDKDSGQGEQSCGFVAAGMLTPYAEIETAESDILALGLQSMQCWPELLAQLGGDMTLSQTGSLVLAHRKDWPDLQRLVSLLHEKVPKAQQAHMCELLTPLQLAALEPSLSTQLPGYYFPTESHIDTARLFAVLQMRLHDAGVQWHTQAEVTSLSSGKLCLGQEEHTFDWVIDCRGLGAQRDIPGLRGVRGEVIWLHAPDVRLTRPVRLMHPRYRIYIVPRANDVYVVGATEIESEDFSPISVRSTLELLSATYSLHAGFAEAHIVKTAVNCRPAMPNNMPRFEQQPGMIRINGLYRHGYLLAPVLCQQALDVMSKFQFKVSL